MYKGKRILGLITARGGSKGVPRKNLYPLNGKSLLEWTVQTAVLSRRVDRLIISSDDPEIISVARKCGCEAPFVRPAELASDEATSYDVALHALDELHEYYDYLILLQPTSPLRTVADIDGCLELCIDRGGNSAVSVYELPMPPTWLYTIDDSNVMTPLLSNRPETTQRQVQPKAYCSNGAIFVVHVEWFRTSGRFIGNETLGYEMPRERSVDIDTEADIVIAEGFLRRFGKG